MEEPGEKIDKKDPKNVKDRSKIRKVGEFVKIYNSLVKMSGYSGFKRNIRYRNNKSIRALQSIVDSQSASIAEETKEMLGDKTSIEIKENSPEFLKVQEIISEINKEEQEIPAGLRTINDSEDPEKSDIPESVPGSVLLPLMGIIVIDVDGIKEEGKDDEKA